MELAYKNPLSLVPLGGVVGREVENFLNIRKVSEYGGKEIEVQREEEGKKTDGKENVMTGDKKDKTICQESIDLSEVEDDRLKIKIVRILSKYATMWKGRLGWIEET